MDGTALCEGPSAVHRLIDCLQVERGQRMGTTRVTNRTVGFTEVSNAAPVSSFAVAAGSCGAVEFLPHNVVPPAGSTTIPNS